MFPSFVHKVNSDILSWLVSTFTYHPLLLILNVKNLLNTWFCCQVHQLCNTVVLQPDRVCHKAAISDWKTNQKRKQNALKNYFIQSIYNMSELQVQHQSFIYTITVSLTHNKPLIISLTPSYPTTDLLFVMLTMAHFLHHVTLLKCLATCTN